MYDDCSDRGVVGVETFYHPLNRIWHDQDGGETTVLAGEWTSTDRSDRYHKQRRPLVSIVRWVLAAAAAAADAGTLQLITFLINDKPTRLFTWSILALYIQNDLFICLFFVIIWSRILCRVSHCCLHCLSVCPFLLPYSYDLSVRTYTQNSNPESLDQCYISFTLIGSRILSRTIIAKVCTISVTV